MNILVIIEFGSETGIEYLYQLKKSNININSLILIGDKYAKKREKLLFERTGGLFMKKEFMEIIEDLFIPVFFIKDINSFNCYNLVNKLNPNLIVFEGSKIIRNEIFSIPMNGMLNVHLGVLPYLRGCSCMEWSIVNDYPLGVTCHFLHKEVDSGPIINRYLLDYNGEDNYYQLRTKLLYLASHSMINGVKSILNGFNNKSGYKVKKGKWYSPMRGNDIINQMQLKIKNKLYKPIKIDDSIPFQNCDVDINLCKVLEL